MAIRVAPVDKKIHVAVGTVPCKPNLNRKVHPFSESFIQVYPHLPWVYVDLQGVPGKLQACAMKGLKILSLTKQKCRQK